MSTMHDLLNIPLEPEAVVGAEMTVKVWKFRKTLHELENPKNVSWHHKLNTGKETFRRMNPLHIV